MCFLKSNNKLALVQLFLQNIRLSPAQDNYELIAKDEKVFIRFIHGRSTLPIFEYIRGANGKV